MWSTGPWKVTNPSASPTWRTSCPRRGGDMAKLEKVDAVIAGAGASGSVYAAVLAKTGKKVVVLEQGPDWKLSDLISSDFWGRRIKTAGAPFLLEGRNPVGYSYQSGWGVGGAALHYFANFPRLLPNDFKVKSEHNRGLDWPISYKDVAPYYDKVARDVGVSGDAKAEEIWRPAGAPYPMPPMKTFRNGDIWLKGFAAAGIRMVPAAVGMNSTDYKERPGRQIPDDALQLRHLGALRRERREPHGHHGRAIHVLRSLWQDQPQGSVRQLVHRRGHRDEDERPRRLRQRAARGLTRIGAFGEEMPNIENRVELALDKDEFGMPLGRIVHSYDQDVTAVWNANFEEGLKIANAAGAKEAWSARGNIPTIHLMGGTIMGTGAGNSVVNGYGQAHEIANLFVAGPGIFPTSGASNPTYTIFALSLRGAEQLAGKWKAVVG